MRNFLKIFIFIILGINPLFSESYILRNITYNVEGSTRESVLAHYLSIETGTSFKNKQEVQDYIDKKNQEILNQRTLSGGVITPSFEIQNDADIVYVDLEVDVKDTWNYVALPYPKVDSNTGFQFGFRAKNYNFLGGMETLSLSVDYLQLVDGGSEYSFGTDFKIPFYLGGFTWNYNFSEDMTISAEFPFKNATSTGLSVNIPLEHIHLVASVNQEYYLNQDGKDDEDGYYLKNSARLGTMFYLMDATYTPAIISSYPYKLSGDLSLDRKGYKLGVEHNISYGHINWFGNFRDGFKLSFNQDLQYNFTRELWVNTQIIEMQYHKYFGFTGLSSRFQAFFNYNSSSGDDEIGADIRGIANDRLEGDSAILINIDFPIKFPLGPLNQWLDAQISPFFDYALVKPVDGSYNIEKGWYGAGLEGFGYLNVARSISLRVSLGLDMEAIVQGTGIMDKTPRDGSKVWEFKLVVGTHY